MTADERFPLKDRDANWLADKMKALDGAQPEDDKTEDELPDPSETESGKDQLLPRIELIALSTRESLDGLRDTLKDEDEINLRPGGEYAFDRIVEQDGFVKDRVLPLMTDLMIRTRLPIEFTNDVGFGYAYSTKTDSSNDEPDEEAEEEPPVLGMLVWSPNDTFRIDNAAELQVVMDMASFELRSSMKYFSNMSKGEIVEVFSNYTAEYQS